MIDEYRAGDFGAAGDGRQVDTSAIQEAIDACHANGGGHVVLEGGTFLSGTLRLRSNVHLRIQPSASLLANPDIGDYGEDTHHNRYVNEHYMDRCLIHAEDAENIGLCGEGEINGNAERFPDDNVGHRPMMIRFLDCRNIHLRGLRLHDAPAWTTAFLDSENIWIDGLDIFNDKRHNGDGLDFDGCRNVFVSNCRIQGTDDNLCLQAGSRDHPVRNVHITNCTFTSVCAGIRIGLKSIGCISGVVISNCTFENVWREGIKMECSEGGDISDIVVTGIVMRNVARPIFLLLNNRLESIGSSIGLNEMPEIGTMRRISISDVIATDDDEMRRTHYRFNKDVMGSPSFNGIRVDAEMNHPIEGLTLRNITYSFIGGVCMDDIPVSYPRVVDRRISTETAVSENYYPDWSRTAFMDVRSVKGLVLDAIHFNLLNPDEREPYILENCQCHKENVIVGP